MGTQKGKCTESGAVYPIIRCDDTIRKMMEVVWVHSIILLVFLVQPGSLNLVVNIKATDGDVVQKDFFADPEKDYVTIEYMTHGSRYVRVYIDFRLVSGPFRSKFVYRKTRY